MDIDKLSEKEREELLSRLSAEKKLKEAAKRKNYQKMRNRFIASTEKRVRKYVKEGMALKKWLHDEADTFYNAMKGYGELKRDEQLGFTVGNDNFRIQVKGNRVKRFDERADIAEKRLIDYLNRWIQSKGEGERNPVYKLAMSLLQRNEAGDLDYESVAKHVKSCGFIVCNQLSNKSFKAFAYQLMNSYKNVSVNQR